jgi:hypothetical protein
MKRTPSRPIKADVARLDAIKAAIDADDFARAAALARPLAMLGEPHANRYLGHALFKLGHLDGARAALNAVLKRTPDDVRTAYNLAMMDLAAGDWAAGFKGFEVRHQIRTPPAWVSRLGPAWDGGPVEGRTILLYADQGFGDAIQFSRYARVLKDRGARVVLAAHPELRTLFAASGLADEYVSAGDPIAVFDAHIALMSLPGALGVRPDRVLASEPYLQAPPARLVERNGVGLVWAGNRRDREEALRSLPPEALDALLSTLKGRAVFSLQKNGEDELDGMAHGATVVRMGQEGFAQTASVIMALDLVIAVDTAVAHLAGALGKPVWLLLNAAPDWRWLRGSDRTPWYRSMRLFRQDRLGDWGPVLNRVEQALAQA